MSINLDITNKDILDEKLNKVKELLKGKEVIVAYSGGVDSSVVAYLSGQYAKRTKLIMQIGSSVPESEQIIAKRQAKQLNLDVEFIEYDEVDHSDEYVLNTAERCYYCKNLLFGFLEKIRLKNEFDLIVSGTNISDLSGHRPGYRAGKELGVVNPLVYANISKLEVRRIAQDNSLITSDKPATACLASRIQTGIPISVENLTRVGKAEKIIKDKVSILVLRVRDHGDLARIEVASNEIKKLFNIEIITYINQELRNLGYKFVTFDMQGYRPAIPIS